MAPAAVMIGSAVIGAGASIYSGKQQSKAMKNLNALTPQQQATADAYRGSVMRDAYSMGVISKDEFAKAMGLPTFDKFLKSGQFSSQEFAQAQYDAMINKALGTSGAVSAEQNIAQVYGAERLQGRSAISQGYQEAGASLNEDLARRGLSRSPTGGFASERLAGEEGRQLAGLGTSIAAQQAQSNLNIRNQVMGELSGLNDQAASQLAQNRMLTFQEQMNQAQSYGQLGATLGSLANSYTQLKGMQAKPAAATTPNPYPLLTDLNSNTPGSGFTKFNPYVLGTGSSPDPFGGSRGGGY